MKQLGFFGLFHVYPFTVTEMHIDSLLELYLPGRVYSDNESRLLAVTPDLSSPCAGKPPRASCAWVEA